MMLDVDSMPRQVVKHNAPLAPSKQPEGWHGLSYASAAVAAVLLEALPVATVAWLAEVEVPLVRAVASPVVLPVVLVAMHLA